MYYVLLDVNLDSKNTPLGFAGTKGFTLMFIGKNIMTLYNIFYTISEFHLYVQDWKIWHYIIYI